MTNASYVDKLFDDAYQNTWKKIFDKYSDCYNNRNQMLYHYTSLDGLTGIINAKELWLTDVQFMNDDQELEYAKSALPALQAVANTEISDKIRDFREQDNGFKSRIFSISFCEDGDLLGQWRGYGSGSGVAVGFMRSELDAFSPARCYKVLYGATHAHEVLDLMFSEYCAQAVNAADDPHTSWEFRNGLTSALLDIYPEIAAIIKNPHFFEEHEWRMIKKQSFSHNTDYNSEVKYRVRGSIIVPYISLSLKPKKLPIHSIVVGPSRNAERIARVVLDMMRKHDYHSRVSLSEVPYSTP